jgi:hypothetical protein
MGRGQSGGQFRQAPHQLHGRGAGLGGSSEDQILDDRFDYNEERIQSLGME